MKQLPMYKQPYGQFLALCGPSNRLSFVLLPIQTLYEPMAMTAAIIRVLIKAEILVWHSILRAHYLQDGDVKIPSDEIKY